MQYVHKSTPFKHQETVFEQSAEREYFAFLMEQGTGKTKPTIDTAAYLYESGKIEAFIIAAPNGVHRKWLVEDFPLSMPDRINCRAVVWKSQNAPVMRRYKALLDMPKHEKCFRIFIINIEALSTPTGVKLVRDFMERYKCLFAIDESGRIKNPESKRTESTIQLGGIDSYRRILNGLPVSKSPFDLYSQFKFLSPSILGPSFSAFKARHADFFPPNSPMIRAIIAKNPKVQLILARNPNANVSRFAPSIVLTDANGRPKYKNLERLKAQIAPHSFRVTKEECLDLPPKMYEKRFFEMGSYQRSIYDSVKQDLRALIGDDLYIIQHRLTVNLRLQQITSGFMGTEPDTEPVEICVRPEENPRLMLLRDTLQDIDGQVIIWARFKKEIEWIKALLGEDAVTYYGDVSSGQKVENLDAFKAGYAKYLVGTAASGGIGHNFTNAHYCIYYSNTFDYEQRAQSEDRQHRIGQIHKVTYTDFIAEDSVDDEIIASLRNKQDLGDYMMDKKSHDFITTLFGS